MRLSAIFSDYDGTLAPIDVPRRSSRIRPRLERALKRLAAEVPIAIVTSKGYDFVRPRTSFADGWACACGLDIRAGGETASVSRVKSLERVVPLLETNGFEERSIEEKRDSDGRLVAICVDWRNAHRPGADAMKFLTGLRRKGFFVSSPPGEPFVDVFAGKPDKGRAIKELKRMLGVSAPALYLGDSSVDNSAFRVAEVSVGVSSGQETSSLACDYLVDFDRLPTFLDSLSERSLEFAPDLVGLRPRRV